MKWLSWLVCQFLKHDFFIMQQIDAQGVMWEWIKCRRCELDLSKHSVPKGVYLTRNSAGRIIKVEIDQA